MTDYEQSGTLARFDTGNSQWASDQSQNVIIASVSGPYGNVKVDGVPEIQLTSQFYDDNEEAITSRVHTQLEYDRDSAKAERAGASGVCSKGYALYDDESIRPETRAGSAPSPCQFPQ